MMAAWIRPKADSQGLPRYIGIVRSRLLLLAAMVALSLAARAGYLTTTEKVYEADTDLLVSPLPQSSAVGGFGLLRESENPTRNVSTIARLITVPAVAERVKQKLDLDVSTRELLRRVNAQPVALSSIVNVAVEAETAEAAERLANAFGEAVIEERTARLHRELDAVIPSLRASVRSLPPATRGQSTLVPQLRELEQLRERRDPTVRVEVPADRPPSPVSPKLVLSLVVALIGGLIVGLGGVFALHFLDPRLRRKEQLQELYDLPILASIPSEHGSRNAPPLRRAQLSVAAQEGYNALRASLVARDAGLDGSAVLVTSPSRSDGKTTTALNLAAALTIARRDVILLDGDWRRPAIGSALQLFNGSDLYADMARDVTLEQALVSIDEADSAMRVLPTAPGSVAAEMALSSPDSELLLERATAIADWVVVDAPPLNHAPDLLTLARRVDYVVIVVHLGRSDLRELERLTDMLVQQDVRPAGFVVLGSRRTRTYR